VVFVPYSQLGQTLTTTVTRENGGVGGLECQTLRAYAKRLAGGTDTFQNQTHVSGDRQSLLVQSLLREAKAKVSGSGDLQVERLAPEIAEAIETLRLGKVRPKAVREEARSESGHLPLLAETYQLYADALEEHDLRDNADLFQEAVRIVQERHDTGDTVYAVFGETELHESALDLIRAFQSNGKAFYTLGEPSSEAPETTAAFALHSDSDEETKTTSAFATGPPELCRAVGPLWEARATFRKILSRNQSLDEVEIAYTASSPYLTLLADEAERLGISFTLGTGLPLSSTRPGQALAGFYEWIENGYEASVLIRLLRNGLLRPDEWIENTDSPDSITGHQLASILAQRRYGRGKEAYSSAFEAAIEAVKNPPESDSEKEELSEKDKKEIRQLETAQAFVEDLIDLVPDPGSAQKMAANSLTFLSTFGPTLRRNGDPGNAMVSEKDNTTEETASAVLRGQVLQNVRDLPFETRGAEAQMARLFREMLESHYVGAQSATAGAVHILPLDSAGFSGREHLYVVGMDSETTSVSLIDDPILTSDKRSDFSEGRDGAIPQPRNAASESSWRFNQALKRHRGPTTLFATTFDPNDGEERHPSTLFLEALTTLEEDKELSDLPIEGLLPGSANILLDEPEAWLCASPAAVRGREDASEPSVYRHPEGKAARTLLHDRFSWIERGEEARRKRRSEEYTEYDGVLKQTTPELDFLDSSYDGPPISAGRLEMLAGAPYAYFLKYVLGIEPREEPALEDEPWLNPRRKGIILHRSFSQFMDEREGPLEAEDRSDLIEVVEAVAAEEAKRVYPGTEATFEEALRELKTCARLFFQSELRRSDHTSPELHEWGFGYGERHRQEGDAGDIDLHLDAGSFPVRGRIDRVDRLESGTMAVWDYKTGSQSSFSRSEPLKHGQKLQWALYALILEQERSEEVSESGYFFTSEKEMGTRLSFPMDETNRSDTNEVVSQLASLARSGSFPISPKADDNSPWRWGDWDHLFRDLEERVDSLDEESPYADHLTPEEKTRPYFL
jgi:RecB family exonuclease